MCSAGQGQINPVVGPMQPNLWALACQDPPPHPSAAAHEEQGLELVLVTSHGSGGEASRGERGRGEKGGGRGHSHYHCGGKDWAPPCNSGP